jgi:DNA processing protein
MVAIVGTRTPTEHGKRLCVELVEGLKECNATIVSGLAYGIDIVAHRTALKNDMPTIGCVAHGLDKLYPGEHAATAKEMLNRAPWSANCPADPAFAPGNFPRTQPRDRGPQRLHHGGGERREGRQPHHRRHRQQLRPRGVRLSRPSHGPRSEGCNKLIQQNKAALISNAQDVITMMEWLPKKKKKAHVQVALFGDLMPDEQTLVDIIKARASLHIDDLCVQSKWRRARWLGCC